MICHPDLFEEKVKDEQDKFEALMKMDGDGKRLSTSSRAWRMDDR